MIFLKYMCEKKTKKRNIKELRQTLNARISVINGQIHLKFGMGGVVLRVCFHSKNG